MARKSSSIISKKAARSKRPAGSPISRERSITPDDIDETKTAIWLGNQIVRVMEVLKEHGADDEMLDALDYLLEDNFRWIDPAIATDILSRELKPGRA